MAVKVIQYGDKRRVKCSCCGSVLEYEKEDIQTVQTGMNEWSSEISCPVCSETVKVIV